MVSSLRIEPSGVSLLREDDHHPIVDMGDELVGAVNHDGAGQQAVLQPDDQEPR